jgi:hypothetical protein
MTSLYIYSIVVLISFSAHGYLLHQMTPPTPPNYPFRLDSIRQLTPTPSPEQWRADPRLSLAAPNGFSMGSLSRPLIGGRGEGVGFGFGGLPAAAH